MGREERWVPHVALETTEWKRVGKQQATTTQSVGVPFFQ